jgi:hypothetical protein
VVLEHLRVREATPHVVDEQRACPAWPLSAAKRSSNGLTEPSSASIESDAIASAAFDRLRARSSTSAPIAFMISVPLISARPSLRLQLDRR